MVLITAKTAPTYPIWLIAMKLTLSEARKEPTVTPTLVQIGFSDDARLIAAG